MADYQIDERTHLLLLARCGLPEFSNGELTPVPDTVAKMYSEFNRCNRRASGNNGTDEILSLIAALCGYGATVSFLDGGQWDAIEEWNAKRLRYNDHVNVADDNGGLRLARMKSLSGRGMAIVQFDGATGETKVRVKKIVPLAEPVKV